MAKRGSRGPTPEKVARVLVDAEELGDKRAAKKHHVHYRTVENYRARYAEDPAVVALCVRYKEAIRANWLLRAQEVRRKALRHMEATMDEAGPKELAIIFKAVHEGILTEGVLNRPKDPHAQHGADPEPAIEPAAEGEPEDPGPTGDLN